MYDLTILPRPFTKHRNFVEIFFTKYLFYATKRVTENVFYTRICHQVPYTVSEGHQGIHSSKSKDHIDKFRSNYPVDVSKNLVQLLIAGNYCIWLTCLFCSDFFLILR